MALVGHGLKVTGNTAVGVGILAVSETAGDFLFDLGHAKVALGAVVGKGHMRQLGEQQHRRLMLFQTFPQIMGIGFGDSAAFAVVSGWNGRKFFFAPGQDIAIAFLQVLVFGLGEFFLSLFDTRRQVC